MTKDLEDVERALGDSVEWGDPRPSKRRKSEKRRRGVVVSVRLSSEELGAVEARASAVGMPIGTYMRHLALGKQDIVVADAGQGETILWSASGALTAWPQPSVVASEVKPAVQVRRGLTVLTGPVS